MGPIVDSARREPKRLRQEIARVDLRKGALPVKAVVELILANSGEITEENHDHLVAVFPESKIEKAVSVFFEITDELEYKAVLTGGNRLVVYTNE